MNDFVNGEAERRADLHKDHPSSRPLSEGYEMVGLKGEVAFGQAVGICPDFRDRPGGDRGVDFVVPLLFEIDVKTARKPYNLILEVGKEPVDILVLAGYDDATDTATLLDWEWGAVLERAPHKLFPSGIDNHYIPVEKLRPMAKLYERIRKPLRTLADNRT